MSRGGCYRASDGRRQHNRTVRENLLRYGSAYPVSGANALALSANDSAPTLRLAPKLFPICNGLLHVETVNQPFGKRTYVVLIGGRTSQHWSETRLFRFWANMHRWFEWEATPTTAIVNAAPRLLPAPPTFPMLTAQAGS